MFASANLNPFFNPTIFFQEFCAFLQQLKLYIPFMIEKSLKKNALLSVSKISTILFISFLLSAYPSKQQKTKQKIKQKTSPKDSLNLEEKIKTFKKDTSSNQEIIAEKEDFKKPKPKSTMIISSPLPDFSAYKNVKQKKSSFFSFLKPIIQRENDSILKQRQFIKEQYQLFKSKDELKEENIALLNKYILDYRCQSTDLNESETFDELLIRVDIIPQELALVQAALESSWGSSYFARVANNLFGQWCFKPGCGIIPRARKEGETHEVAKFRTLQLSVKSYMLFLNSHPAFSQLRKERAKKRSLGEKPEALSMANGLKAYSARGEAYITEVKSMIRTNSDFLIELDAQKNTLGASRQEEQ